MVVDSLEFGESNSVQPEPESVATVPVRDVVISNERYLASLKVLPYTDSHRLAVTCLPSHDSDLVNMKLVISENPETQVFTSSARTVKVKSSLTFLRSPRVARKVA